MSQRLVSRWGSTDSELPSIASGGQIVIKLQVGTHPLRNALAWPTRICKCSADKDIHINGKHGRHASGTSTPALGHTATSRPLVLLHPTTQTRISINVPSTAQEWIAAEVARDTFQDWLHAEEKDGHLVGFDAVEADEDNADAAGDDRAEKELVLTAYFLRHVASLLPFPATATSPATSTVLVATFAHFVRTFLEATDVHSLGASLSVPIRSLVISSYFAARTKLEVNGQAKNLPKTRDAALLRGVDSGDAEVYGLFGGQGMNEVYFDELQDLYELYGPLLIPFLALASDHLSKLAAAESSSLLYDHSLDALAWLQEPSTRPPVPYLASCAVSLPLIGLTQLSQYVVYGKGLNLGPRELGSKFKGATGHSQGVVSACVIAAEYPPAKADGTDSWTPFYEHALHGLTVLFQIGLQGSLTFPPVALPPTLVASSIENGEGTPTPMLAVNGLELSKLEKKIKEVNSFVAGQGRQETLAVSLHNGPRTFVVTGAPKDLVGLADGLRKSRAPVGKDQSKIPHSKRLPVFSMRFLHIGVPYHSHLLSGATERAMAAIGDAESKHWAPSSLALSVFNTEDGSDLRSSSGSFLESLFTQIFTSPIYWGTKAINFPSSATHAIDFGTGGASGVGYLCVRCWEGRGIRTIMLGNRGSGNSSGQEAWTQSSIKRDTRWTEAHSPRLVKTADGKLNIDTPFSRLLSKPPLMIGGMTPCTVRAGFVSAVMKAGYHIELAGGGHYNEKALRGKIAEIQKLVNRPGMGITLNSLYINQRQWTFQLPLWQTMRQEGLPVEGLCVAAGIPSTEKAKEIIDGLRESGIKHVSFKPGSVDGIRQVVAIAAANPDYPIILQWTGGRAGGHHSCEDFHAPVLATYASIRQQPNISLVAGSGFGGADDTYPYLSGEWSEKLYGVARMPFDGFLFASRVMVAKEAHTSESVKQLIVDAQGVDDDKWEQSYDKPVGGIITVTSELGEPIHKVATRGVKLWGEFDKTVFALPREKQVAWLQDHKQYVIDRLNADFQKPWFPAKSDGTTCDLDDMTYAEVNSRLVRLMYVAHEKRWIDISLRNLMGDWIRRVEERLSNVNSGSLKVSALQSYNELDDPQAFLTKFNQQYPAAAETLLSSADVAYFLAIAQRPGQKPVPFIPVLDQTFSVLFKKDSLWQAEDIEAVFDQDPQRVCILQGPVAVKYCTTTQQPIGEMLGEIESSLAKKLLDEFYGGDESKVPTIDYLAPEPKDVNSAALLAQSNITHSVEALGNGGEKHSYFINGTLPSEGDWLAHLGGPKLSWLQAFLSNLSITSGDALLANPVKRVLAPRHGQRVELSLAADGSPLKLDVFGGL
ncbi:BQ5605_C028g10556 [Microbotryum silenes-dioicae]|uniref:BQ5605_C028g10556 protein n=1 Tax=Microbotryum silenes-dioicae TaxID=796604 RepID=A0A2X0NBJ9_9BASI|nr:BQ5605_C028g10556 [Microbotryum silenes-dioicae]